MDYVIKNNKEVYIRLNENGQPVTCSEISKGLFEYSKAKNILANLPKNMKKFHFKIDCIPDVVIRERKSEQEKENMVITSDTYQVPDEVNRWLERFGICDDIISEAKERRAELEILLSNTDKEISNILHIIEIEKSKNAYQGYLAYKQMKDILGKRRIIKDEKMILEDVIRMNFSNFQIEKLEKCIHGLAKRKFTLRVTEEVESDALQEM